MKQLNQIVLCSEHEGRSFLRELAVFDDHAIVTHLERLPYLYHELVRKHRGRKDLVETLDVPIEKPDRYAGCPYCGNRRVFQCSKCGFYSCLAAGADKHHCPGCDRNFRVVTTNRSFASRSGFVDRAMVHQGDQRGLNWSRATQNLFGLIRHLNQDSG